MNPLSLIQGQSLVAFLIIGFIAANALLCGAYLVQRGVARMAQAREE